MAEQTADSKGNGMTAQDTGDRDPAAALRRWAFRVRTDDRGPGALVRCWFRIIFIVFQEFSEAAISLRAAALTYSIVLALVPLLAMSTAILKGLGGGDQLKVAAYRLLDQLEPEGGQVPAVAPTPGSKDASQARPEITTAGPAGQKLTRDLRQALDTLFNYVDRTNFTALGAFGVAGLLLTVILMMSTVEEAMNAIWHTDQGRSLPRKIMDYLALLLLLPVSINVAIAGEAILASPTMLAQIQTVIPSPWAVATLLKLLPFFFVLLSLTLMYMFFPNVRVSSFAALTGAVFAGVFWFLGQKLYLGLQIGVARSNAIYGSFATVPLFLLWVQMGWTFILLGATLSFAVQNRNLYRLPGATLSPEHQLQLAFDVLQVVYANFARKKRTTATRLIAALKEEQPGDVLAVAATLVRGNFLLLTGGARSAYLPTEPAEAMAAGDIVRLVFGGHPVPTPGGRMARAVITAGAAAIPGPVYPAAAPTASDLVPTPDKEANNETTL